MKKSHLIFILLINIVLIYSQDSIVSETIDRDSETIESVKIYHDVDLQIHKANIELDSLYQNYQFKNPAIKNHLIANSNQLKEYIIKLIDNIEVNQKPDIKVTDYIYNYSFNNSNLKLELEKYIKSIHELKLNKTVKKVAIDKIKMISDIDITNDYTNKNSRPITILKIQLYNVIWSEIYLIDNESITK